MGDAFILGEGQCLGDKGTFVGGVFTQYQAKSFEDVQRYMEEVLVKDEAPHINWDKLVPEDREKATAWCRLICHDTVNDWKKLHNV